MEGVKKRKALILAAGRGKRMGSESPKCLVKVFDMPMIEMVIKNVKDAGIDDITFVLGYKAEEVLKVIGSDKKVCYQEKLLGTASAVMSAKGALENEESTLLIIASDMPFVSSDSIKNAFKTFYEKDSDILITTAMFSKDNNYGRVIRNEKGNIIKIVERKDCTKEEMMVQEVNASVYIVKSEEIFELLEKVGNNNKQNEYYFTDVVKIYRDLEKNVTSFSLEDDREIIGINSEEDLALAKDIFK